MRERCRAGQAGQTRPVERGVPRANSAALAPAALTHVLTTPSSSSSSAAAAAEDELATLTADTTSCCS